MAAADMLCKGGWYGGSGMRGIFFRGISMVSLAKAGRFAAPFRCGGLGSTKSK